MSKPLRADAARNRDRLRSAAEKVFAERGLDAPLEEVARRAEVSIGTLYNHFASRDDLLYATLPRSLPAELDRLTADALAADDPWDGFVAYIEGLFRLHAEDQAFSDLMTQRHPVPSELLAACGAHLGQASEILARAQKAGHIRPGFTLADQMDLFRALAPFIRETRATEPDAWRRLLAFYLNGIRTESARPVEVPPVERSESAR